ncbi:hypothetical protein P700755_001534 [Psychroflexus torquis ATCC 700755]|uniref:Uncharacterized protein n=1 Tax=Psychroflexus torquis (strain ATCC 700755 / CIP 106069 / ACAM 623) TaxID=313595 RepID=K4IDD2_PSYTT|nr:hypothetical protein [Psychroflexus torquis]AFU68419.1 hypothetical protein P700755_001534 [Psychroflexus torquis ATCC 700755]
MQSYWFSVGTVVPWEKFVVEVDAIINKNAKAELKAHNSSENLLPNNEGLKFWKAVALVKSSLDIFSYF